MIIPRLDRNFIPAPGETIELFGGGGLLWISDAGLHKDHIFSHLRNDIDYTIACYNRGTTRPYATYYEKGMKIAPILMRLTIELEAR